jgi:hypothetical protein
MVIGRLVRVPRERPASQASPAHQQANGVVPDGDAVAEDQIGGRSRLGSSLVKAAITARSAQAGFGRATSRRRIATSCRSNKISTSFDAPLRASYASHANRRDTAR